MDAPLWLRSAAVQALLTKLVDRLDNAEARATVTPRSLALNEKSWPALYRADPESLKEQLWEQLQEMQRWGWVEIQPESAARSPYGYDKPRLTVTVTDIPAIRLAAGRPERLKSAGEQWREAVERFLVASDSMKSRVCAWCIDLPGHTPEAVVRQLNLLPSFADNPYLLREVSARLFWGMSKVLDHRQDLVALLLGLDECPFPESPIQLQVYLPPGGFTGVLFIENLMSFEQATRHPVGSFAGLALVFASGFKGSAARLRTREGASLYYSDKGALGGAEKDMFQGWLFGADSPVQGQHALPGYFWGDLDWAGMRILQAMRRSMPGLTAWQPGYGPMLAQLMAGEGHSPESADKQGQRSLELCGCAYADQALIPALQARGRFVDQELFSSVGVRPGQGGFARSGGPLGNSVAIGKHTRSI